MTALDVQTGGPGIPGGPHGPEGPDWGPEPSGEGETGGHEFTEQGLALTALDFVARKLFALRHVDSVKDSQSEHFEKSPKTMDLIPENPKWLGF
jgi:hypothetical protein